MTGDEEQRMMRDALRAAEPGRQRVLALCEELGYGFVMQAAALAWAQKPRMGFRNMVFWLRGLRDEVDTIGRTMKKRHEKGFSGKWPDYMLKGYG